jgi:hypothetical protein
MSQDRAHGAQFHVTHEFLAYMLGVRRVGVTMAAGDPATCRADQLPPGRTDGGRPRSGLEATACGCYAADRQAYADVLPAWCRPAPPTMNIGTRIEPSRWSTALGCSAAPKTALARERLVGRADRAQPALLRHRRTAHAAGADPRDGLDQVGRGAWSTDLRLLDAAQGPGHRGRRCAWRPATTTMRFPLSVWQTGSGTQSHMNVNEVVAPWRRRRCAPMRAPAAVMRTTTSTWGSRRTTSSRPRCTCTALRARFSLLPALQQLRAALAAKALAFATSSRSAAPICRTRHPVTLGQEFGGYEAQLGPVRRTACATPCTPCTRWRSAARRSAPA